MRTLSTSLPLFVVSFVTVFQAHAGQLECVANHFAKPLFTAQTKANGVLANVKIDVGSEIFASYFVDKSAYEENELWSVKKSIASPSGELKPVVEPNALSYSFKLGESSWSQCKQAQCEKHSRDIRAKLSLDPQVSSSIGAILSYDPSSADDQSVQNQLQLNCIAY